MKYCNLLFVILICFLASCSEVTNPSYIDDIEEYMPMSIGNYWVYDVYDSLNNVSHIDSMVVVSDTIINNKKMFAVYNFRNEFLRDTGYYCTTDNSIALYGKVLMPLLWTPDAACFSKQTKKIYSILDSKEKWSCVDSVVTDQVKIMVPDSNSPTGYKFIPTISAYVLKLNSVRNVIDLLSFNGFYYHSIDVDVNGYRIFRILSPEDFQFTPNGEYEYFDNNRAFIQDKLILNLQFAKGIGIISSYEKAWLEWNFCQTRRLLRYNIK
ncbi:MAG: hypothetical protein V1779_10120 [bacterium]